MPTLFVVLLCFMAGYFLGALTLALLCMARERDPRSSGPAVGRGFGDHAGRLIGRVQ